MKHNRDSDIRIFTKEMLRNIQGGMSVPLSLRMLHAKDDIFSAGFLDLIRKMRDGKAAGSFLYETMRNQAFFPESYVDLVRKCEASDLDYLALFQKLVATYGKHS